MTDQTQTPDPQPALLPAPVEPPPLVVDLSQAEDGDRLAALYAAYPTAKAEADEASARLKAIVDGMKALTTALSPDLAKTPKFELRGGPGLPAMRLSWQITRRFNSTRFKKEQAGVYESYREPSGSWVLTTLKDGE